MSPPSTLGRYHLLEAVGRGGMGVVYRAQDPVIDREVAIKVVRTDPSELYGEGDLEWRFEREFKALGKLSHPHIVTIYDVGRQDENAFIAMEFVAGANLEELLTGDRKIPPRKVVEVLAPVASALDYAHGMGIIHRDIKPANILIGQDGSPKLTDFGIAKMASLSVTRTGQAMGTPIFMSPEQVSGVEVGGAADQFSLAALLYRCLTGSLPFQGDNVTTVMFRVANDQPRPPSELVSDLPPAVDAVLRRALAKKPEERFDSCVEMVKAVERALDVPSGATMRVPPAQTLPAPAAHSAGEKGLDKPPQAARPAGPGAIRQGMAWGRWITLALILAALGVAGMIWTRQLEEKAELPEITTPEARVSIRLHVELPAGGFQLRVGEQEPTDVPEFLDMIGHAGEEVPLELWRDGAAIAETRVVLGAEPVFTWRPLPPRSIRVVSEPPGAEVRLDGEVVDGHTPLEVALLPFSQHELELRLAGHERVRRQVSLEELAADELTFELAAAPPPGLLTVEAPYPVRVAVGGKKRGQGRSLRIEVPPGQHAIELTAPEVFFSRSQRLRFRSGERLSIGDFPRAVSVHIAANPANCRVSIDGRFVDTTPTTQRMVLGDHELSLEWPALGRSTKFTERILRDGQRIFKSISP